MPAAGAKRFAKVFDQGWQTLMGMAENAMALKVFAFIAQHCDHMNALVCSTEVMAEHFGVSERTIRRATKFLQDQNHLVIAKVGNANAYVLDPNDLFKNYDRYKAFCAFNARTLTSKNQNKDLKMRMTHFLNKEGKIFEGTDKEDVRQFELEDA